MGSVSVQLGLLAIAKDWAHADVTDLELATARATAAGHRIVVQQVVGDTESAIRDTLARWISDKSIDVIVVIGGGESEAVSAAMKPLVSAPLPGFTDLFRWLMFQEQGASAMLSSAEAARCGETFVFVLPGAVGAAMDKLILPQFDPDASGKNLLKQLPRLRTDVDAEAAVPQEIAPEKTQGGSGMPARLPASSGVRAQAHATGKHVVQRGATHVPKDPDTAPIDLQRLERDLATSASGDPDATRQSDLQKMLPKLPPGADAEDVGDVTKTDMVAAPPRPPSKGADLAAKLASVPSVPARLTPVPKADANRLTPVPARLTPIPKVEPANRATPIPSVAIPSVTINPRKRNEPGSKPPAEATATPTPTPDAPRTPTPDVAARARRASASLGKSGAPTTVRTKPPTEPPKGQQRAASVFSTQMSASPPPPKTMPTASIPPATKPAMLEAATTISPPPKMMIEAPTTVAPPKGMLGAETVISRPPTSSGAMPLDLDDEAVETVDADLVDENTGRFKKAQERVDTDVDSDEQLTKRADRISVSAIEEPAPKPVGSKPPTKPPPGKKTAAPAVEKPNKITSQEAFAQTQAATARPAVDDLPKERRNSGGLPRGTFNYPAAKKGVHPAVKILGLLAIAGLGFGAVVFAFREKKPATGAESTEQVAHVTIDASESVVAIDASIAAIEVDASIAAIEVDAAPEAPADAAIVATPIDAATQVATNETRLTNDGTKPTKPTGTKPVTTPTGTKPTGTKPVETKPVETKPVETKPAETPVETPPADDCDETACVAANYDKPCCAKYKPKGPEIAVRTEGGLPQKLDRMAVRAGVDGVRARVTTCGEKAATKGTVKVHVTVSAEGAVTESTVESAPDDALGTCVANAMKAAKFAKSEEGGSFSYPFVF